MVKMTEDCYQRRMEIFPLIKIKIEVFYLQGEFINSTLLFV